MSDTLTALEAALRESPDDPVLLDAITDYFLDHDDPRGEYIRAVRAGDTPTAERLMGGNSTKWMAHQPPDYSIKVRRWHYCWPTEVEFARVSDAELDALRQYPLVDSLVVRPADQGDVGDEELNLLIASGVISRLLRLTFDQAAITDTGARALARCSAVTMLVSLKLPNCMLSPMGLDTLTRIGFRDVGEQNLTPWWGRRDVV